MIDDLRLAIKHLRRSPLFVVVAVMTLGLGIGLTSTMLTMLDAVVHPYVPYRDVKRLYSLDAYGDGISGQVTAYDKYQVLINNSKSFEGIATSAWSDFALAEAYGNAAQVRTMHVSGNYFSLLGLRPEMGRFFVDGPSGPDEDKAVVSYGFWQSLLAGRPFEQGLNVTIDGRDYAVIGVMPPETGWPVTSVVLRTAGVAGTTTQQRRFFFPVVRLKPGVSDTAAYAELNSIAERLAAIYGQGRQMFHFRLRNWNVRAAAVSDFQVAMAGAAAAVLLIVCANLANLMLVRGLNRRAEMALRLALGAGRRDLVRQLFTEGALIGLLGGAVGTMLAVWGLGVVRHNLPLDVQSIGFMVARLDWRVYAFALGTTVASVVFFGLGPALTACDVSVTEPLKEAGTTTTGRNRRRYSLLVISEVAICLVLLMAAGLMLRRLDLYNAYDPGYDPKGLVTGSVNLTRLRSTPDSLVHRRFSEVAERLRQVPGVLDVAVLGSANGPGGALTSDFEGTQFRFLIGGGYRTVSPEYVRVRGYRIVAGRDFAPGDRYGGPLVIVDEYMADRLWPGIDPVGRMLKLGGPMTRAPWARVVGVIRANRLLRNREGQPRPTGQLFVMQPNDASRSRSIEARVSGNPAVVGMAMRRKIADMFPAGSWNGGYFWEQERSDQAALQSFSFLARLFTGLGGFGLVLAAVGMYGVLAYAVAQRMREFGIRIALGAETRSVFRLVLHDAAVMILAGTAIGAWFAMWGGTLMVDDSSMIPPTDWIALVASEAILLLVCFGACLTPAIRASRANPLDIIRAI